MTRDAGIESLSGSAVGRSGHGRERRVDDQGSTAVGERWGSGRIRLRSHATQTG